MQKVKMMVYQSKLYTQLIQSLQEKPSPVAREQSPFIKHRQKLGEVLRNQKDKKVVLLNKPKPFKINFNLNSYDQPALDADVKLKKEKLDRLRKQKEEVDPDLFKGLGIFLGRKF